MKHSTKIQIKIQYQQKFNIQRKCKLQQILIFNKNLTFNKNVTFVHLIISKSVIQRESYSIHLVYRSVLQCFKNVDSFIAGLSTRNQRIERMWRDVLCCVIHVPLYFLGPWGWATIYYWQPYRCAGFASCISTKINQALKEFNELYNNHQVRTESNGTQLDDVVKWSAQPK